MSNVKGVKEIQSAISKHQQATAAGHQKGLFMAGLFLQRESQLLVPIDTGNLRGSASTIPSGSGFNTEVTVGYGAEYAVYVHENLEARHKPGKVAKFLETPLREKRQALADVYTDTVKRSL